MITLVFAYFTPETALPLASVLTAVFGFFMLVGRAPIQIAKKGWRNFVKKVKPATEAPAKTSVE